MFSEERSFMPHVHDKIIRFLSLSTVKKLLGSILMFFSVCLCGQSPDGLLAKFNLDKADIKNERAILYGTSFVEDRFGNSERACLIHGNFGSFINLGTGNSLKPKEGSVSMWIKVEHLMLKGKGVESNPIIYTRSHEGEDFNEAYYVGYEMKTKTIGCCVSLSEMQQVSVYSGKEFTLNTWHHLVITYDYNYFCLYIDGALEAKMIKNFDTRFRQGDSIIIGNRINKKNTRFLNACIDDIGLYNKVLSSSEVIQLFNAPNPNKSKIILNWVVGLLGSTVFILLMVWFFNKRVALVLTREREKNEMLNRSYEQDNKVLKAQMNPHFIFNSLNSIQQFIITKDNDKAELYLSKFAKLMRKLLESNVKESISLAEEIELIEKYLEIESLRFGNVFEYEISVEEGLIPAEIHIPHFLMQPVVENAIWHGLLPKTGPKQILLTFKKADSETLLCSVDDNGVGRKSIDKNSGGKQSFALQFIHQRLELMSKIMKKNYEITITDKIENNQSAGTLVCILMPIV